jgi:SAM-dependent methyltransferase
MDRTYDRIGIGYADHRRPDPRIASLIAAALGDARTVVSVGAGTGSYDPQDRTVVAAEPSRVMIAQRPPLSAPVVRAEAENLPFRARSFDAALAILTVHHWRDPRAGLTEMCRVAEHRIVVTFDPEAHSDHWLVDYMPELRQVFTASPPVELIADLIGATSTVRVPLRHDTPDGMTVAYWRRPNAYLDPAVRAAGSAFHQVDPSALRRGLDRLEKDLASGRWHRRYAHLLQLEELDVGLRLVSS